MVTRQKPAHLTQQEFDDWERWEALYNEAFEKYQGEWYAIEGGRLYHAAHHPVVTRELTADGIDPQRAGIFAVLPPPPHRV